MQTALVIVLCVLLVGLELLVCVAILAPDTVANAVRRLIPNHSPRSARSRSARSARSVRG
jgi:hypothetical protein